MPWISLTLIYLSREYSSNQGVLDSDTLMILLVLVDQASRRSCMLLIEKNCLFPGLSLPNVSAVCTGIGAIKSMIIARWRGEKIFFLASHVKLLARESSLPQFVLLHVNLYQVLRGIDSSYWPRSLRKRELLKESRGEKGNGEHRLKARLAWHSMDRLRLSPEMIR